MSEHRLRAMNCDDIRARTVFPSTALSCPVCEPRQPAPEPSPAEQQEIERFGIFAEEEGQ